MRYYRDIDYFIYFEDFPHMGIPGIIIANSDGTANIYINTLYSAEKQKRTLRHELRHFAKEHLYNDWLSIEEKEQDADALGDGSCTFGDEFSFVECEVPPPKPQPARLPDIFKENPTNIPIFNSLDAFTNYLIALKEQYQKGIW